MAPRVGLEPTTTRLTAGCSTIELPGSAKFPGNELLSHRVAPAVPSPLEGLTAGFGMWPGVSPPLWSPGILLAFLHLQNCTMGSRSSPRPISTGQLKTLLSLHSRPIYLVICEGSYQPSAVGDLILGLASRLDAFSAYPLRT